MAVFVLLTTWLVQKGSPESRRPGVKEPVDSDPRDFAHDPEAPWPVRRGGWILRLYEHSLGLAFILLFLLSWVGHALGGFSEVAGLKSNLTLDLSPGFGYTGIVVAMLAMLNPLGVVLAAIFVAGIFVGADAMSRTAGVPSYIADVMVATALLTMVVAIMLTRFKVRWR